MTEQEFEEQLEQARELNLRANHRESASLLQSLIDSDESNIFPVLKTRALIIYASVVNILGRSVDALAIANEARDLCYSLPKEESTVLLARVLHCEGTCHHRLSNFDKALPLYNESLALCNELGLESDIELCLGDIANVYKEIGDYAQALEYYQQAVDKAKELDHLYGISRWLNGIGIVYQNLREYEKALEYFQQSLAIGERSENNAFLATMLGNISAVYNGLGEYTTALDYAERALRLDEKRGNKVGVARHHGNIGQFYIHSKDYHTAIEHLTIALSLDTELGNRWNVCVWTGLLGTVHAQKDYENYDPALAEEYFFKTLEMSIPANNKVMLLETHSALSDLYKDQERWKEHAEQFRKFYDVEKELHSEEVQNKTRLLENRRRVEEAERDRQVKLARLQEHEKLLMRVLPPTIAQRMVGGEDVIADYFPNISILFADIKGFTTISAGMPALVVVQFLDSVFGQFDAIMLKHGCEKIKTIGDGYMAVCGAPNYCEDNAERLTFAALEMLESLKIPAELAEYFPEGNELRIRIGIHCGPVVAGVVGNERFVYDVYSDAVNTASRMESHGEAGRVHVSSEFAQHLQNRFLIANTITHGIRFIERGEIEIKGKGMMRTYFLEYSN